MSDAQAVLVDLERAFWDSMIAGETDVALKLLQEPSLMVSPHGSMKFDHRQYRQMAEHGEMVIKSYELSDIESVFPSEQVGILSYRVKQVLAQRGKSETISQEMFDTSTWVRTSGKWRCVMHTETPVQGAQT